MQRLSERVKKYRMKNDLSLMALAERIGVSHTTISNVERGMEPQRRVRFKIEQFLKNGGVNEKEDS